METLLIDTMIGLHTVWSGSIIEKMKRRPANKAAIVLPKHQFFTLIWSVACVHFFTHYSCEMQLLLFANNLFSIADHIASIDHIIPMLHERLKGHLSQIPLKFKMSFEQAGVLPIYMTILKGS